MKIPWGGIWLKVLGLPLDEQWRAISKVRIHVAFVMWTWAVCLAIDPNGKKHIQITWARRIRRKTILMGRKSEEGLEAFVYFYLVALYWGGEWGFCGSIYTCLYGLCNVKYHMCI